MKPRHIALSLAVALTFAGCAGLPSSTAPMARVSADYEAAGDASGIRAFVYGQKTVIEFDAKPVWVSVQDANGVTVPGERLGRHYRLTRKLDDFSLWTTTRAVLFSAIAHQAPSNSQAGAQTPSSVTTADRATASALPSSAEEASHIAKASAPKAPQPVKLEAIEVAKDYPEREALELASSQLNEIRSAIARESITARELTALRQRADEVEARLVASAAVLFQVHFETAKTEFKASDALARVLIPAAKAAQSVNVRGRTDSKISGPDDPAIALERAKSAQRYLIAHGVHAGKITVSSLAQGDLIAPATVAGRAFNRRVEIELTNPRFALARAQSVALARPPK